MGQGERGSRGREPDSLGSNLPSICHQILASDFASLDLSFPSVDGLVTVSCWEAECLM